MDIEAAVESGRWVFIDQVHKAPRQLLDIAQLCILRSCVYLPLHEITLVYFRLGYKIHRYGALRHQTHSR